MVKAVDVVVDKAEDLVEEEDEVVGEAEDFIMHVPHITDLHLHRYMVTLLLRQKYTHQTHTVH